MPAGARGGRSPVRTDLLEKTLVEGTWKAPRAGDALPGDEKKTWVEVKPQKDGSIQHSGLAGGYALWTWESPETRVMVLEARSHGMVYVNGDPRPGDPYGYGYLALPVSLKKGANQFLFFGGRGAISAKLRAPEGKAEIGQGDATLPDLVVQQPAKVWCGVVVRNNTEQTQASWKIRAKLGDTSSTHAVGSILPCGLFKVPLELDAPGLPAGEAKLELTLLDGENQLAKREFTLGVKAPTATRKVTFRSEIDGSVQYFGLVPAAPKKDDPPGKTGLVLSLHGASVEGIGQAACYTPRNWAHIVAPTNRRPYGFDWEDWGRMDAIEVLNLAQKQMGTDPAKTWVTGHSMGGHGTWHLGVTYPDRFAALAPSAGWVSMFSYAGARRPEAKTSVAKMLARATNPSDTLGLVANLTNRGVYVLHGDADDNVPVTQARAMRQQLGNFHPDFAYYERKGVGHWWGNECVDWPPLMRFLQDRNKPDPTTVSDLQFRTFHPGISSKMDWMEILTQKQWGELSEVKLRRDLIKGSIEGSTTNVERLRLHAAGWPRDTKVSWTIDGKPGQLPNWGPEGVIELVLVDKEWKPAATIPKGEPRKRPQACGPIKEGFSHRMVYVVGVSGTPAETKANLAKAQFDQETFYYRGNGAIEVTTDLVYLKNPESYKGRNLVLVGNRVNNRAWPKLDSSSPIMVDHGQIDLPNEKRIEGEDKALVFVRPKPGEPERQIVFLGATGTKGMKLLERLSLWVSGSSFPDFLILEPEMLSNGMPGIIGLGYFDSQWNWDPTQTALR